MMMMMMMRMMRIFTYLLTYLRPSKCICQTISFKK